MKNEKGTIVLAGGVIGLIAAILVFFGNPANMGFCIACFLRDTTGALGLHSAAAVQYIRPEIIGLVLGACIISLAKKEFRPRGGSAPVTRFTLGAFVMIGCLMFLGCPFRMILRLAGGDGNALFGLVGFVAGILTGTVFLKKGYTLKRSYKMPKLEGSIYPAFQIVMLLLLVAAPAFIHFTEPEGGPGAKHAAIVIALAAGIIVGILAQRTRLCMVGGIRDAVLFKEYKLLFGFAAILVTALGNESDPRCSYRNILFQSGICGTADRTHRWTVERTGNVSGRLWMYSPRWMPASSAYSCRRGKHRFSCNCSRADGGCCICPQLRTCIIR